MRAALAAVEVAVVKEVERVGWDGAEEEEGTRG